MNKVKYYLFLLSILSLTLVISGCSGTANSPSQPQPPKVVQEDKDTRAMTIALSDLNTKTKNLTSVNFTEEYNAYEQIWGTMQGDYDNLKSQASITPYDEAQITSIKNTLQIVKNDLQGLNKVNAQVTGKIEVLKKDIAKVKESINGVEKAWIEYQKSHVKQKKYTASAITSAVDFSKTQIPFAVAKINAAERDSRMQNGRANGLFNSVQAYVKSMKLSE